MLKIQKKKRIGITKAEVCHCIFNDLRCVRDNEDVSITWKRIKQNREEKVDYDYRGDIIRYASDIIDYMVIANLIKSYDEKLYYLNKMEEVSIKKFVNSKEWFDGYDKLLKKQKLEIEEINEQTVYWFLYVNRKLEDTDFSTDIISLLVDNPEKADSLKANLNNFF
jgi:hypothetical protein